MIDREANRENLRRLTAEELIRVGGNVWRDILYERRRCRGSFSRLNDLYAEWCDITGEAYLRGYPSLVNLILGAVESEAKLPQESVRAFLDRTNREIAMRKGESHG